MTSFKPEHFSLLRFKQRHDQLKTSDKRTHHFACILCILNTRANSPSGTGLDLGVCVFQQGPQKSHTIQLVNYHHVLGLDCTCADGWIGMSRKCITFYENRTFGDIDEQGLIRAS